MAELKKDWILSQEAFRRLLEWLDDGKDSGGERYLEVRRRLTAYFERKNCLASDELADETLHRVAHTLEEKGKISGVQPLHYCYIKAKFVFLEAVRKNRVARSGIAELRNAVPAGRGSDAASSFDASELAAQERLFNCLERCLGQLPPGDRELILSYYRGERRAKIETRTALAARLGLTPNALSIRACRIRNKLEACVKTCTKER